MSSCWIFSVFWFIFSFHAVPANYRHQYFIPPEKLNVVGDCIIPLALYRSQYFISLIRLLLSVYLVSHFDISHSYMNWDHCVGLLYVIIVAKEIIFMTTTLSRIEVAICV